MRPTGNHHSRWCSTSTASLRSILDLRPRRSSSLRCSPGSDLPALWRSPASTGRAYEFLRLVRKLTWDSLKSYLGPSVRMPCPGRRGVEASSYRQIQTPRSNPRGWARIYLSPAWSGATHPSSRHCCWPGRPGNSWGLEFESWECRRSAWPAHRKRAQPVILILCGQ